MAKIRRKAYLSGHRAIKDDMPDGSNYFCGGVVLSYNSHLLECYTRARGLVESLSSGNGEFDRFGFTLRLRIQYNLSKTIVKTQLNHNQVKNGSKNEEKISTYISKIT